MGDRTEGGVNQSLEYVSVPQILSKIRRRLSFCRIRRERCDTMIAGVSASLGLGLFGVIGGDGRERERRRERERERRRDGERGRGGAFALLELKFDPAEKPSVGR